MADLLLLSTALGSLLCDFLLVARFCAVVTLYMHGIVHGNCPSLTFAPNEP